MDQEKRQMVYNAEDIQKYFSGKLTPSEMHAMERDALEDTFLAEAMEGYEGMPQSDVAEQLILLKEQFAKPGPGKTVALKPAKNYKTWKLAAALLLLLGGVMITYLLTNNQPGANKTLASVSSKQDTINSAIEAAPANHTNPKGSDHTSASATGKATQPSTGTGTITTLADSTFIYRPRKADKSEEKQVAGGGYTAGDGKANNDIATTNAAPGIQNAIPPVIGYGTNKKVSQPTEDAEELKKSAPNVNHRFLAQVTSKDGTPLPFVNISKEGLFSHTDAKGNFGLLSMDSVINIKIKSVGYIARDFTLKSNAGLNKIALDQDMFTLKGKTLTSRNLNAVKPGRAVLVADTSMDAAPVDGWQNYEAYITNNFLVPNTAAEKGIHGEIEVSFDVQPNGLISNIKIDTPLCGDCDEAALRAIKEGPGWKIKKGGMYSAKVKIRL